MNTHYGAPAPLTTSTPPAPTASVKEEDQQAIINTLSVANKIPNFWPENPRLWFIQIEAILSPQKTSDVNKYFMVVAKLSKEAIQQVADIVANPPENNKFETLKKRLLQIYEESETRQIQKLVSEMELGDQKPSQLLRRMRELARDKIEDDTLKILWQGHLPSSVRAVLTVTSTKNLEELAVIADKIMDTHQQEQINEVARSSSGTTTAYDIAAVMAEIAKINLKMEEMDRGRGRPRARSRSKYRNCTSHRSRSRSRRTPQDPDWLCSYHWRYRNKARKCVAPCSWKNKDQFSKSEN